ncbi:hypothetical protein Hamer_G002381, partial [Homarus americanus]
MKSKEEEERSKRETDRHNSRGTFLRPVCCSSGQQDDPEERPPAQGQLHPHQKERPTERHQ